MSGIYTRTNTGANGLVENRATDHKNEEFFRDILDKYFYNKISDFVYERMSDRDNQLKGIDLVGHIGEEIYVIDEKTQTSKAFVSEARKRGTFTYILDGEEHSIKTACTPTFCFELACCKLSKRQKKNYTYQTYGFDIPTEVFDAKRYPGWFLDANKETKQYICVWPHNLNEIEIMMITRQDLLDSLKDRGLTDEIMTNALLDIQADAAALVHVNEFKASKSRAPLRYYEDCLKSETGEYDAWFTSSVYNLAEAPINLICRKNYLLSLPNTKHWILQTKEERLIELQC